MRIVLACNELKPLYTSIEANVNDSVDLGLHKKVITIFWYVLNFVVVWVDSILHTWSTNAIERNMSTINRSST